MVAIKRKYDVNLCGIHCRTGCDSLPLSLSDLSFLASCSREYQIEEKDHFFLCRNSFLERGETCRALKHLQSLSAPLAAAISAHCCDCSVTNGDLECNNTLEENVGKKK